MKTKTRHFHFPPPFSPLSNQSIFSSTNLPPTFLQPPFISPLLKLNPTNQLHFQQPMAVDMSPEFHFTTSTTAPSSPRLFPNSNFHYYSSAPTSPTRAQSIFSTFQNPDFSFHSGHLSFPNPPPEISSADELFHNGRILPLPERGRKKSSFFSENRVRVSRSVSPLRDPTAEVSNLFPKSDSGRWKWRLKDFLLFRSASEGRATGRQSRDPLRNYALFSSFFSSNCNSLSPVNGVSNRVGKGERNGGAPARKGGRRQVASAHENLYTVNRAAAEEQRKKTPLAYQRQGFFGFIQYNPAIRSIAKGFTSSSSRP